MEPAVGAAWILSMGNGEGRGSGKDSEKTQFPGDEG